MLTIVQDEQHRPLADAIQQRFDGSGRPASSRTPSVDATALATRCGSDRGARSTNHLIGMRIGHDRRESQRQLRLADAADARERDQAVTRQQRGQIGQFVLAADQRCDRRRQVVPGRVDRDGCAAIAVGSSVKR